MRDLLSSAGGSKVELVPEVYPVTVVVLVHGARPSV